MPFPPCLVLLATAWGPRFGGINAFNVEVARSLGIVPGRRYGAICVVPQATADEVDDARRHAVQLLSLSKPEDQTAVEPGDAGPVLKLVRQAIPDLGTVVWIGHDDKTGPAALALRDLCPGSHAVLVHHMAFGAYQDFKKGDSASADEKRQLQRALFSRADLCLAVGPMLRDQLNDLLLSQPQAPAVDMLVPGLAEPDPTQVRLGDRPPMDFTAFLGGRLGSDDERIKQALLGVRGFGHAVKQAFAPEGPGPQHAIRRSPTLRMRGVPGPQHDAVRQACIQAAAGQVVNFDLANYTDDRHAYFGALAGSSVAMMPSWHEGFGLAAWEAIACQVPVVLGEQSGVYRLLNERCQGAGLGRGVRAVPVQGRLNRAPEEPPHTEADVAAVGQALFDLGDHMDESKASAVQLASILRHDFGFTWAACADQMVQSISKHLGMALRAQPGAASGVANQVRDAEALPRSTESSQPPDFLCPPQPRPRAPGLGDSPSALLVARDQVVRFDAAREPLIQDWLQRLDDPALPQISLRLVVGEGGTGKTRSALELLRRVEARDGQRWTGLWMPAELPPDALALWGRYLAQAPGPVVLVVDYADGRQPAVLQILQAAYDAARAHTANPGAGESPWKLHLLCLARRSDWWPELQRADAVSQDLAFMLAGPANRGVETLPDWPDDLPTRQRTYLAALQDYARAQGLSPPAAAWAPRLEDAPYERPLYIHLAALAALAGARPEHAQALLADQVGREFRVWQRQASRPDETPPRYADWAAVTAWFTLVQGGDRAAMSHALAVLNIQHPAFSRDPADLAPIQAPGLGPLQPDLLGEALVIEQLAGPRGANLMQLALQYDEATATRALEVVARLAERPDAQPRDQGAPMPAWAACGVAGLARALPQRGPLLVAATHVLGYAVANWLFRAWAQLPDDAKGKLGPRLGLPRYSTAHLSLAVEVARVELRGASTPESRANALNALGVRLGEQGGSESRAEALRVAREAADIYRTLAQQQAAAYLPDLAMSLNTLAIRLSEQGDAESRGEALRVAREAVAIYRTLAKQQPGAYLPDLAGSLNNLAISLSEQGDAKSRAEALRVVGESVHIYGALHTQMPAAFERNLGIASRNFAQRAIDLGLDPDTELQRLRAG